MAGDPSSSEWLRDRLVEALNWDAFVVEGVVDAVASARNDAEVKAIVEDYMGGNPSAKQWVDQYLAARRSAERAQAAGASSQRGSAAAQRGSSGRGAGVSEAPYTGQALDSKAPGRERGLREAGAITYRTAKPKKGRGGGGGGGSAADGASSSGRPVRPDKDYVNCVACGKIYSCRATTSDVVRFLESGGFCTFCGAKVALTSTESSETNESLRQRLAAGGDGAERDTRGPRAAASGSGEDAEAKAAAFKDRLVAYDRDSARRTVVHDDQSDYFEIDSNAWLTPEERQQLRERQAAIEAAEASRRRAVTVTFDLLGRQVVLAEDPDESPAAADIAADAAVASAATAAEKPQGGGTGAAAAAAVSGGAASAAVEQQQLSRPMRIVPSSSLRGPAPIFVRPAPKAAASSAPSAASGSTSAGASSNKAQPPAVAGKTSGPKSRPKKPKAAAAGAGNAGRPPRLQHDDPRLEVVL